VRLRRQKLTSSKGLLDPPSISEAILFGTAAIMSAVSLVACLIPARRAAMVDPVQALRAE